MVKVLASELAVPGGRPGHPDPGRHGLLGRDRHAALLAGLAAVADRPDHQRDGPDTPSPRAWACPGRFNGVPDGLPGRPPAPVRLGPARALPELAAARRLLRRASAEPHPVAAFVLANRGIGISLARLFTLFGSDINDGPLLAESAIELHRPLAEDADYEVRGAISRPSAAGPAVSAPSTASPAGSTCPKR